MRPQVQFFKNLSSVADKFVHSEVCDSTKPPPLGS